MSKSPQTEPLDNEALIADVANAARLLGMRWMGPGGVFPMRTADGADVWRVYSEWMGTGTCADVDVQTGAILRLEDELFETVGEPVRIPPERIPTSAEVSAFVEGKLELLGWNTESALRPSWQEAEQRWIVQAQSLQVVVTGARGKLRLVSLARGAALQQADP